MGDGDAEATNTKFRDSFQKIAETMHQKRKVDSVDAACRESRVVEQGRERMADGIANHTINSRGTVEQVGAVKFEHFVQRNLARRGGFRHWGVGERASFAQGKKARRQPNVTHRHGHKVSRVPRNFQEANAVGDGFGLGGDFHGVHLTVPRNNNFPRQFWRALEVVNGEQDTPRRRKGAQEAFRQDRKSTRLNSSHSQISYAVFCLKKKKNKKTATEYRRNANMPREQRRTI